MCVADQDYVLSRGCFNFIKGCFIFLKQPLVKTKQPFIFLFPDGSAIKGRLGGRRLEMKAMLRSFNKILQGYFAAIGRLETRREGFGMRIFDWEKLSFRFKYVFLHLIMAGRRANTIKQGLELAMGYCSTEERYQKQVETKLIAWGLNYEQAQQVIAELISNNFISEERFSKIFAVSKLRQSKWGRVKIRMALKEKYISDQCIKRALDEIDTTEYYDVCLALCSAKLEELKAEPSPYKEQKLYRYMFSKGFEFDLVKSILGDLAAK
ncbi:MAG: RecX family transcriptional regulator [Bacteroidales bacterium]|nr:RecX family transcriptional regulator [Bacteroidales bacterium]